jgi:hypothetical protein
MQDLPLEKKKGPPIAVLSLTDLRSVLSLRGGPAFPAASAAWSAASCRRTNTIVRHVVGTRLTVGFEGAG